MHTAYLILTCYPVSLYSCLQVLASASLTPQLLSRIKPMFGLPSNEFMFIAAKEEVQESEHGALKVQETQSLHLSHGKENNQPSMRSGKAKIALPPGLEHIYLMVTSSSHKIDRLHRCINALRVKRAIVFVASQGVAMYVWEKLIEKRMLVSTKPHPNIYRT